MTIKNEGANVFRKTLTGDADAQANAQAAALLHDAMGRPGPYRPSHEEFDLGWLRFALTDVIDGGTYEAPALVLDSTGATTTIPITVTDALARYQADAVAGDTGYAQIFRNPDGSTTYEVTSLGNAAGGGGGGGMSDHKFSVNSDGTDTAGFGEQKVTPLATPGGSDVQAFWNNNSGQLEVWVAAADISTIVLDVISGVGSTNDHKVLVDSSDTTPQFLYDKIKDQTTYDSAVHQLVYAMVTDGSGDENVRLFTAAASPPSGGIRFARVTTAITAASSATSWGGGVVKLQDKATGAVSGSTTDVDNPLIGVSFVVDCQVEVDMSTTPPQVINGLCDVASGW